MADDIHADADEQHVAEGIVAHLPADQVPGESEHDKEQKLGKLRLMARRHEGSEQAKADEPGDEQGAR